MAEEDNNIVNIIKDDKTLVNTEYDLNLNDNILDYDSIKTNKLKQSLNTDNTNFDLYYEENEPDKYCKPRRDKRGISNDLITTILIILTTIYFYKLLTSNIGKNNKIIKIIFTHFLFSFIIIILIFYKILFPFFKTKYVKPDRLQFLKKTDILSLMINIKTNKLDKHEAISINKLFAKYESKNIPNSYIIKYILEEDNDNGISSSYNLTFKEYMKYLFDYRFRIINFSRIFKKESYNLKNDNYITRNNQTTLWKNMIMNELDYYIAKKGKLYSIVNITKILKYYILNTFFYNWPLLFDNYKKDNEFLQIQDKYKEIYKSFNKHST